MPRARDGCGQCDRATVGWGINSSAVFYSAIDKVQLMDIEELVSRYDLIASLADQRDILLYERCTVS